MIRVNDICYSKRLRSSVLVLEKADGKFNVLSTDGKVHKVGEKGLDIIYRSDLVYGMIDMLEDTNKDIKKGRKTK